MKIIKQIDLCFIFQPQKPKVQSCFLNHQKLRRTLKRKEQKKERQKKTQKAKEKVRKKKGG
jgi:hypothetical protein